MKPKLKVKKYNQLYLIDTEEAVQQRNINPANHNCDNDILNTFDGLIRNIYFYAENFHNLRDRNDQERREGSDIINLRILFNELKQNNRQDKRFSKPEKDEIAIIFDNEDSEPPFERYFEVFAKQETEFLNIRLQTLSRHMDPMVYVAFLLFRSTRWQIRLFFSDNS